MIGINVNVLNKKIDIFWKNASQIRYYDFNQSAKYFRFLAEDLVSADDLDFEKWKNLCTKKIENQLKLLADDSNITDIFSKSNIKILSVGSGTSTVELVLSKLLPTAKFYLVDKDQYDLNTDSLVFTDNRFTEKTVFQNSWLPFEDGVISSNIDRSRFTLLDPKDDWPDDINLVYSFASWGWHYNNPTYVQRLKNIKSGGSLMLSILLLQNNVDSFIASVSKMMGSEPTVKYRYYPATHRSKLQFGNVSQKGGIFNWTKTL